MWQLLTSLDAWAALVSLTALEIVLGIDNVVFISVLVSRLDARRGETARRLGLALALIFRIALLFALTSLLGLSATVFILWGNPFSWHDLMIAAVLIAVAVMYAASRPVAGFIAAHPTTKMLALAFLVLIGVALLADGFGVHLPRGYIYFAMSFAAAVEAVNIIAMRRRRARRGGKR